ncbi:MAG: hypothetical protein GC152_06260 [Alphaproteobacteria bacterium]|nr:hypothetical protein [Alphaproteobacteria bacterium]
MTDKLTCGSHGEQDVTYVCRHVIETLKDGEPRGFWWNFADGAFEAVCAACNDLTEAEAKEQGPDLVQPLCYGCFRDAAALNGVDLD